MELTECIYNPRGKATYKHLIGERGLFYYYMCCEDGDFVAFVPQHDAMKTKHNNQYLVKETELEIVSKNK